MAINKDWLQIAGFSVQTDGTMGLVWLSVDPEWDVLRVHHSVTFKREILGVVAGELNRKAWVPVAWENEEFSAQLLNEYGCNMLYDRSNDIPAAAERLTNEMNERMETGRFKIGPGGNDWAEEFERFNRRDSQIPRDANPLMAATRHAVDQLAYARREAANESHKLLYPKVGII